MFDNLSNKLAQAFQVLKGDGKITEINVAETLKEVGRAVLDADVSFKTAKEFTNNVKKKALGQNVLTTFCLHLCVPLYYKFFSSKGGRAIDGEAGSCGLGSLLARRATSGADLEFAFFFCGKPPPASAPSHHGLPTGELEGQDCSIRAILARRCARGRPRAGLTAGGRHEVGMPALGPLTQACRSRPRPKIVSSQLAPTAQPTATRGGAEQSSS